MKTTDKIVWLGFFIVAAMITCGIIFRDTAASDPLLFVGYVFGLPFLLVPLIALQKWSEDRKSKNSQMSEPRS